MQREEHQIDRQLELDEILEEYRKAFLNHRCLKGFGEFKIPNVLSDIKDEKDPERDSDSHEAKSDLHDALFSDFYLEILGTTDFEWFSIGDKTGEIPYAYLRREIKESIELDFADLTKYTNSGFACKDIEFAGAWYNEKLRAAIRGLKRAKCEIRCLPTNLDEKVDENTKREIIQNAEDFKERSASEKSIKRFMSYCTLTVILAAASYFVASGLIVKNELKKEKQEMYSTIDKTIDNKIKSFKKNINSDLEQGVLQILSNALDVYAPNIGKDLDVYERLNLVLSKLEDEKKKELIDTAKKDLVPYFQNKAYYRQMSKKEREMFANNIESAFKYLLKSGKIKITLSDWLKLTNKK